MEQQGFLVWFVFSGLKGINGFLKPLQVDLPHIEIIILHILNLIH